MNKKKMIPILTLCAILIVVVIAMLHDAKPKPATPLDEFNQTADTEPLTETETETETSNEPSESEAEPVTEERENASEEEVTEAEVTETAEESVEEINNRIFAKNEELPTELVYTGIDVSDLMLLDDYEVGGFMYHDEYTTEQYFIYADCDLEEALSCVFEEPIKTISEPEPDSGSKGTVEKYYVTTDSHDYEISYDYKANEVFRIYKDHYITITPLNREDADRYISNFLSDDAPASSGCGCGCGLEDCGTGTGTGSECGDNDSCGNM